MSFLPIVGDLIEAGVDLADEFYTSDEERMDARLKEKAIDAEILGKVHETNIIEGGHASIFVAGWRPFIGWAGGVSLALTYIPKALVLTGMWCYQVYLTYSDTEAIIPPLPEFPILGTDELIGVVMAMLGVGAMRSYDKLKNTDTKRVK